MGYEVVFENYADRHFIKTLAKKYKTAWDFTLTLLQKEFEQIDLLFQKSVAEVIVEAGEIQICKTEFKIAGTNVSRHASGNRCIVAVYKESGRVHVLLVYHKNDIAGGNETSIWKNIIRENYPEYKDIL